MMIRACLLSLLASSAVMAVDKTWSVDVRGHVGASSPLSEIEGDSVDGKMSLAWGIDAGFRRPLEQDKLGLVLLAGVFRDVHNAEENNIDLDYTVLGANLAGGLSYQLQEKIHLEGLLHARLGTGELEGTSSTNTTVSGDRGISTAFGLSAGVFYTFPFKLMVGGTVGYEFWQGESDVAGSTIDVAGDGPTFSMVAGYAF